MCLSYSHSVMYIPIVIINTHPFQKIGPIFVYHLLRIIVKVAINVLVSMSTSFLLPFSIVRTSLHPKHFLLSCILKSMFKQSPDSKILTDEKELNWEAYYIPHSPISQDDYSLFPKMADKYKQTMTYKMFKECKDMVDDLLVYDQDHYSYSSPKLPGTDLWINSLKDTLLIPKPGKCHICILQYSEHQVYFSTCQAHIKFHL